jgi:hypothetical protein
MALDPYFLQYDQPYTPTLQSELEFQMLQSQGMNEVERGFLGKVAEAFSRGQEGTLADIAIYEALQGDEDLEGALILRRKLQEQRALDPLEGSFLSNLMYKSATAAGQMWESAKRSTVGSILGAGVGAGVGGVAGFLFPTVGEEPIAIGSGAWLGAKLGARLGGAGTGGVFMYKQGVGSMYASMLEQGINHDIAKKAAEIGAVPYALIELAQLSTLAKPLTKIARGKIQALSLRGASGAISKGLTTYIKTLGAEVGEEALQEMVQIATEQAAKGVQEGGLQLDEQFFKDAINRTIGVSKEAAQSFALLPLPGAALEAGVSYTATQMQSEMGQINDKLTDLSTVQVKDVNNPVTQLMLATRDLIGKTLDIREKDEQTQYRAYVKRAEEAGREPKTFGDWQTRYRTKKIVREQEKARKPQREARAREVGEIRAKADPLQFTSEVRKAVAGKEYEKLDIAPLQTVLPVETLKTLIDDIKADTETLQHWEAFRLAEAIQDLYFKGKILTPSNLKLVGKMWGPTIQSQLASLSELAEMKPTQHFLEMWNFGKATAASIDVSRTMRQNILAIGNPKAWFKALVTDWHTFFNDERVARQTEKDAMTTEAGQKALASGIRWNDWGPGVGYSRGTERFASRYAGRIPGIARSERAYALGGNLLRMNLFGQVYEQWQGTGKTNKDYRDLAHVINIMTGEGDVRWLGQHAATLNAVFFAPRLVAARIQAVTELFNPRLSKAARKYLAWNVTKFVGVNTAILTALAGVKGVDVERDPRSTDFGKIKIGKTRVDFWGGYLPLARTVVRLATRQRKTQGGVVVDAPARDTITRFLQAKLGPMPAAILDMVKGETFYGEEREFDVDGLTAEFYERFTPFFLQDVADAIRYQGLSGGAVAPLAFFGASTMTYPMTKSAETHLRKDEVATEVLGAKWDTLGPEAQSYLRERFPDIELMERQARFERSNRYFMDTIEKGIKASQKRVYDAMPADVRRELDTIQVVLSGVGKRIGTNWYLSDKRHRQYEKMVIDAYKGVLPKLTRSDVWKRMDPLTKAEMIKRITDELKSGARKQIVFEANMKDLQRVKYGG